MYNRYQLRIEDEFAPTEPEQHRSELPGAGSSGDRGEHSGYRPDGSKSFSFASPEPHLQSQSFGDASSLHMLFPGDEKTEDGGFLKSFLRRIHIPKLDTDDLLLLAIAYLLLRDSGDEDLILIVAALYLFR